MQLKSTVTKFISFQYFTDTGSSLFSINAVIGLAVRKLIIWVRFLRVVIRADMIHP